MNSVSLNQKEKMLLEDMKKHEKLCVEKYNNYAQRTQDSQLQQMFLAHAQHEQKHVDTLQQILNGQVPDVSSQKSQGQQQNQNQMQMSGMAGQNQSPMGQSQFSNQVNLSGQGGLTNQSDATLCEDLLKDEKYVSSAYNTAIFEFRDSNVRQVLNHIQKEEQKHGEDLYNYMASRGLYQ